MRFAVPYSLAALRTIRNGRPDSSEAAAASATAPSSGRGEPRRVGACSRTVAAMRSPSGRSSSGPRLEAVLVEVVARALAGAQQEVALEIRVLDERRGERIGRSPARGGEHVARDGQQRVGLGRAVDERDHRAVVEVDVDAVAAACANERRKSTLPAKMPVAKPSRARSLRSHRPPSSSSRSLRLRRLAVGAAEAALQVVEDEPDRRRRRRSSRRSAGRRRGRRRRCPRRRGLELRHVAPSERKPSARSSSCAAAARAPAAAASSPSVEPCTAPLSSKSTAASICDEISVRSASAWAASTRRAG